MTRDMELIRQILLEIKSRKDAKPRPIKIDGPDIVTVNRHLQLLEQEKLIDAIVHRSLGEVDHVLVKDMTWAGHDLIAVLENKGVWNQIKQKFSAAELAGLPLAVLKDVGVDLLKVWARDQVGLN